MAGHVRAPQPQSISPAGFQGVVAFPVQRITSRWAPILALRAPERRQIVERFGNIGDRWVMWREETDSRGRPTKVPYQIHGTKASSVDPTTWAWFSRCVNAIDDFDGIGVVLGDLGDGRHLVGIDLDMCLADGVLTDWAKSIVDKFRSYAEISPSGLGLKIFGFAEDLPDIRVHKIVPAYATNGGRKPEIALYVEKRYFTVTGEQYGAYELVEDVTEPLFWLAGWLGQQRPDRETGPSDTSGSESSSWPSTYLSRLWETGDHVGPDKTRSGADAALACALARAGLHPESIALLLQEFPHGQPKDERQIRRLLALAAKHTPGSPGEAAPPEYPDSYPEELWGLTPWLDELRAYAVSRGFAPDALLVSCLVRYSSFLPKGTSMDTGILNPRASLNLFGNIIGPTGAAKTETIAAAEEIVPAPENAVEGCISTGEGLAEAFMGKTGEKGKEERAQVRWNAFLTLDEGLDLYRLDERKGATIMQRIRTAWTGQRLGEINASADRKRNVKDYHLGIVIGWQPCTIAKLLKEKNVGTPQRWLYVFCNRRTVPTMTSVPIQQWELPPAHLPITFPPHIRKIISETHYSDTHRDEFEERANLMRCKVAAIAAAVEFKPIVTDTHWRIAELLVETSLKVVRWCAAREADAHAEQEEERIASRTMTAEALALARHYAKDNRERDCRKVLAFLRKRGGSASRSDVRSNSFYKSRRPMANEVIEELLRRGEITESDGKLSVVEGGTAFS